MGLDAVEIVMEVEETFDISIEDKDAEKLRTVGDLYRYILARIELQEKVPGAAPVCLKSRVFYRFRAALLGGFGVDRRSVNPTKPIEQLVPIAGRRVAWRRLGELLGWRLPELRPPAAVESILFVLPLVTLLSALIYGALALAISLDGVIVFGLLGLLLSPLVTWVGLRLASPWAVHFPADCGSVRGVVERTLALNYGAIRHEAGGWTQPEEVWITLREIFVKVLGVRPEEVTEDADIVRDLGVD